MKNYVDRRTGRYIHTRLQEAKSYVWVCSPYIDTKYVDILLDLAARGIEVRLISSNRQTGFYLRNYLKEKSSLPGTFHSLVLTGSDFVHAKLYVIDDNYALDGSVNLTQNGLWNQPNYIHIHQLREEVAVVKDTFNRIWDYNSHKPATSNPEGRPLPPEG